MKGGEAGIVGVVEDQLPEAVLRQQPEAIRIVTKGGGPPVAGGMLKFKFILHHKYQCWGSEFGCFWAGLPDPNPAPDPFLTDVLSGLK